MGGATVRPVDGFFSGFEDICSDLVEPCKTLADQILIRILFNLREVDVVYAVRFLAAEELPDFIAGVDQNR